MLRFVAVPSGGWLYLDLQSFSFLEFLLERELEGTWAVIVPNTEVKG